MRRLLPRNQRSARARRLPQALSRYPRKATRRTARRPSIAFIVTAAIPFDRPAIAIAAMRHGKDVMVDKPAVATLAQLQEIERIVAETGRIWSVCFSERFLTPSTLKALELVQGGAIGRLVQTIGLGPHRLNRALRPAWFWDKSTYGGILNDIASHQIDQFLAFTGADRRHDRIRHHRRIRHRPRLRRFRRDHTANPADARLHPRRLVYRRRPAHLGRRPPVPARHRGHDRTAEIRRYRRAGRHRPSVHRQQTATRRIGCEKIACHLLPRLSPPTSPTAPKPP